MIPTIESILDGYEDGSYTLEMCLAWIEEHIALAAPQWIDCDVMLPDDGQKVLAGWFGPSATPSMESLVYAAADEPGGSDAWFDAFESSSDRPTHWMPLPAPPVGPSKETT